MYLYIYFIYLFHLFICFSHFPPLPHTRPMLGYRCAIIPGGIAEMYLVSDKQEGLFLRKRQSTVKAAIQEGILLSMYK